MLDVRPIGIEDYTERCSKPLSELHDKLWVETYAKTHSPGMMVGPVEGQFLKMLADLDRRAAYPRDRHVHRLQHAGMGRGIAEGRPHRYLRDQSRDDGNRQALLCREPARP